MPFPRKNDRPFLTYAEMEYVQSDHYDMNIEPGGTGFDPSAFSDIGGWEREKPLVTHVWVNYVALGHCKTIFRSSCFPIDRAASRHTIEK